VALALSAQIEAVERRGDEIALRARVGGEARTFTGDALLVAAGRRPNIERLRLGDAGVLTTERGVVVDDHLRTANPRVFAAGDVCSRFQFTHSADAMARIVIQNALFHGRKRFGELAIPWATYTDPEVAHVGMSAEEAAGRADVTTFTQPFEGLDRAVLEGDEAGFARVHAGPGGRILGATMVGAGAGDAIGEMAVAIQAGLSLGQIAATVHPYPTRCEAWRKIGDQWSRTRLTPAVARLMKAWLGRLGRG